MIEIRRLLARLFTSILPRRAEKELAREISAHLQLLEDDYVAKGLSRDEARLEARRAFGGVEQAKELQRDARAFRWIDNARIDFKLGARMLAKYPALSLIGGAGLAVGVALGAGFFAFLYALFYATLPMAGGERIVALENWDIDKSSEMRRSMHDLALWQREMKSVGEIGAFRSVARNMKGAPGGATEAVEVAQITSAGFHITGAQPVIGRGISVGDERAGVPPIVVIGYDVWQSRFGGDREVLGKTLRLGDVTHSIVGVMPEGYGFPVNHSYWITLSSDGLAYGPGEGPDIYIFGRLRDGVALQVAMQQAQAELSALGAHAAKAYPNTHGRLRPRILPYAHPILDIQGGSAIRDFAAIQSMVSMLALIVAVNVGVLVYARTATRQREIAVRTALGATRRRIVGQLFIEALVLSALASAAGIWLAKFGLAEGLAIFAGDGNQKLPYFLKLDMPWAAYVYVAIMTVFAALVAGVLPALQATGGQAQDTLKQASGTQGLRLGRVWTAMIIAQVAIAVIGVPTTIKIGWDAIQGSLTKANYDEETFLAASLSAEADAPAGMTAADYARESELRFERLTTNLVADLERDAAVADVTLASSVPGSESRARIVIEGTRQSSSGASASGASLSGAIESRLNQVASDFFDAFGARVIAGRGLRDSDSKGSLQAVVVNRAFVNQVLGGANAVGLRLHYVKDLRLESVTDASVMKYEIVGVVSDLAANKIAPDLIDPVIYHVRQRSTSATALIRTRGKDPLRFSSRFREMASALDPTMRLRIVTFKEMKRQQMIVLRLMLLGCSLVVVTVLLLSAAGIYAMMSFTVSQRRKEIGIRAAMGADAAQILRSIFTKAALQLAAGVAVGIVMALVADWASHGELLGSFGRAMLPVAAVVMAIVGLLATFGPARRGLLVPPTEALRAD